MTIGIVSTFVAAGTLLGAFLLVYFMGVRQGRKSEQQKFGEGVIDAHINSEWIKNQPSGSIDDIIERL